MGSINSWAWHPIGVIHAFLLQEWFKNIHEPDVGNSQKDFNPMDGWDLSLTWIDDQKDLLVVSGYSPDSFNYIPAVTVWNIEKEEVLHWFFGPEPEIEYVDRKIFRWDTEYKGVSIWDLQTGNQIYHNDDFIAKSFHKETKTWLQLDVDKNSLHLLKAEKTL